MPKITTAGLLITGVMALTILVSGGASSANSPRGDGKIRLFNYHLDEFADIKFRNGDKTIPEGLDKVHHMFRSRDNSEAITIDLRLIDLLDHLQDHFQVDAIEIISGYRRKAFNDKLREEGHSVGKVSFHTKGMAADIHIDEIREETLRDYALSLQAGGVGYYGPLDFVHVDFGPVRQWGGSENFKRKLVGVLDKDHPLQLTSNKNDYLGNDRLRFKWSGASPQQLKGLKDFQLERFYRGKWQVIAPAPETARQTQFQIARQDPIFKAPDGTLRLGKYRWTFKPNDATTLSSNEFYLKKQ